MVRRDHNWGVPGGTPDDSELDETMDAGPPVDWSNVLSAVWTADADSIRMGANGTTVHRYSAFLRAPMSLLPSVTLNSVLLNLTAYATTTSGIDVSLQCWGIDEDDCPALDTDRSGLSLYPAIVMVAWNESDWTQDVVYPTPDLAGLLRLYLDRPGYDPAAGYYWGFVLKLPESSPFSTVRPREFYSSDHASAATKGPTLVIEYTMPDGTVQVEETLAICRTFTSDMAIAQEVTGTVGIAQKVETRVGIAQETSARVGICQEIRGTVIR